MNAGKSTCFFFLTLFCCLPTLAFQVPSFPGRSLASASSKVTPDQDELDLHRSAAESYQLSGDLMHAAAENRQIVSIALIRLAAIAATESKLDQAVSTLTESIGVSDTIRARISLGEIYLQNGDLEKGLEQARAAVLIEPENGDAQESLGKLLYVNGDFTSALPVLEKTLRLKPSFDGAYALGVTYLQLKQAERAKLLFEELLVGLNNKALLHLMFGKAYDDTNYPTEAEREFKKAIEIDPKLPRAHFYLGYLILQSGGSERLSDAGKEFEQELVLSPSDPFSNFFVGVVASSNNDHVKAVRYLSEAIRFDAKIAAVYLFLGQSQAELGDDVSAEKSLRKAIELTTDKSKNSFEIRRAHFLLGRLLRKVGRNEEGEKELALARELQGQLLESTRDTISRVLGQVATANPKEDRSNSLSQVAASNKPSTIPTAELGKLNTAENQLKEVVAQGYHNLAIVAVQQGQIGDALEKFAAASRWKIDFPGLDRNWGIVAFNAKSFDQAIQPLSRRLKIHPDDALIRRMLAVSYYFTKQFGPAVETLKPVAGILPGDPELSYFYGISLVQLQRNKEASLVFASLSAQNQNQNQNKNLNHDQTASDAHFYAGQGFVLAGDLDRALIEFRSVSALDPSRVQAHYNSGQILIRLNRLEEAESEFRKELQLVPDDPLAKYHLAYSLLERKTGVDEAVKLLREIIAAKYDYADARYQLGKALIERGELAEAVHQLETAANLDPEKDYIHYQLSIAYRRTSRTDEANRELKTYQDLKAKSRNETPVGMGPKKDVP